MAHGKHPLDVFRSSAAGFDRASRARRTVSGKVISRSAHKPSRHEDDEPPPKPQAPRSKAKPRAARKPTSARARKAAQEQAAEAPSRRGLKPPLRPRGFNPKAVGQALFSVAVLSLAVLAVWVVVETDWGGGPVPLKTANADDVLSAGPGAVSAPAEAWYTVRVATYSVNEIGTQRAWTTRDLLEDRGLPVFDPVGVEQVGEDGVPRLTLCQLLVGQSTVRDDLEPLKAALRAVSDWPHGDPRPFADAEIVLLPEILVP